MRSLRAALTEIFDSALAALAFRADRAPVSRLATAIIFSLHALGFAAVARYFNLPPAFLPLALLLLAIPLWLTARAHNRAFDLAPLAPLFFLYAMLAARFIYVRAFGGFVPGYFDDVPPEPHAIIFFIEPIAFASLLYSLTLILFATLRARVTKPLAILLAAAALLWAGAEYFGHRARGVNGGDPYAYVQMGIDFATRGAPLHRFPLFENISQLGIRWYPVVHVGYYPAGDAPSVWPIGGSLAYAFAFRVFGEEGLYWVNPIFSILCAAAIVMLAREIFSNAQFSLFNVRRPMSNVQPLASNFQPLISALSAFLWLTSATVVAWAVVPMVDSQATFFSTLAIYFALRWKNVRCTFGSASHVLPVLSGLALGLAYFIRHTQVLLAPAICVLLLVNNLPRAARLRALALAALASLSIALPDLVYHQVVFGNFLTPESRELELFSLSAIGDTLFAFSDRFFAAYEFGWLAPFLFYGAYRLARDKRLEFIALSFWLVPLFAFHLLYPALRLRDLLPEFPPLIIFVAYGIVALIQSLLRGERAWQKFAAAFAIFCALWLPTLRVWNTLRLPFQPSRALFGYLNASQRVAFDRLAELTPPRAVIGATLNSGAIDLYARREAFRPADWNANEHQIFLRAMFAQNRGVYLLKDGTEIERVIEELQKEFSLRLVAVVDVPLFGAVRREPGALYEIKPK